MHRHYQKAVGIGCVTLAITAAWLVFAHQVMPSWIQSAHQGGGPWIVRQVLATARPRPAEFFLDRWRDGINGVTWLLAVAGSAAALAAIVKVRPGSSETTSKEAATTDPAKSFSRPRLAAVTAVLAAAAVSHAAAVVAAVDFWPSSPYTMFSSGTFAEKAGTTYVLYAVGPSGEEFPLGREWFEPLGMIRFRDLVKKSSHEPGTVHAVTRDLVAIHCRRLHGMHEVRLYEETWPVRDPAAGMVARPIARKLVTCIVLDGFAEAASPYGDLRNQCARPTSGRPVFIEPPAVQGQLLRSGP
jgi:hypothetical protein